MRKFLLMFFLLNSLFLANANLYYADVEIIVDEKGLTSISGITDYVYFSNISNSPEFTSKDGKYWILNISSGSNIFENYIFSLSLPQNSEINYIKTTPNLRFVSGDNIQVIGTAENKPFNLLVQYSIDTLNLHKTSTNSNFFPIISLFILTLLFLVFFSIFKSKRKKNAQEDLKEKIIKFLPQRQKDILSILDSNNGQISQKELESNLDIPKSSISRNLKTLEAKGFIKRENLGQSKFIFRLYSK